jgi:predicted nucleotidyltransferase
VITPPRSGARGDATPDSDLDLLVTVGPTPGPWFPGGLIADLEDLLSLRVQVVIEAGLNSHLKAEVLSEAVPL